MEVDVALARLEEQVRALRERMDQEFASRDKALWKLDETTTTWKEQANEWRQTVNDVGRATAESSRDYVDGQLRSLREYVDQKSVATQRLVFAVLGAVVAAFGVITQIVGG